MGLRPLDPIFQEEKRTGAVQVGNTPGIPPPIPPPSLQILGSTTGVNGPNYVIFDGVSHTYLGTNVSPTVAVHDVSNPASPTEVFQAAIGTTGAGGATVGLALSGTLLTYSLSNVSAVKMVDASNPASLSLITSLTAGTLAGITSLLIDGTYLYVARGRDAGGQTSGISVVDISDPSMPAEVEALDDSTNLSWPRGMARHDDYLLVANWENGRFTVVDISDPLSLSVVTSITGLTQAYRVATDGEHAFVVCSNDYFRVVDISDPSNPVEVGAVTDSLLDNPTDVVQYGQYCFVTASVADAVVAIDVSDPTTPSIIDYVQDSVTLNAASSLSLNSSARELYVTAGLANRLIVFGF